MANKSIAQTLHKAVMLKGSERSDALGQMFSHLLRSRNVGAPQEVTRIILDREEAMSSGIGSGIAVPHARHKDIAAITVVFGLSKGGIGWVSPDYAPVNFVCMLAAPVNTPDAYLEVLGSYLSKLRDPKFRAKLLKVPGERALSELWLGRVSRR